MRVLLWTQYDKLYNTGKSLSKHIPTALFLTTLKSCCLVHQMLQVNQVLTLSMTQGVRPADPPNPQNIISSDLHESHRCPWAWLEGSGPLDAWRRPCPKWRLRCRAEIFLILSSKYITLVQKNWWPFFLVTKFTKLVSAALLLCWLL
jgi:hypothetical protein